MLITLVVAMAKNRVIGRGGGMPWKMPSDLKHLRAVTMGKPVVMGRKTFDSVGKLLDGRTNYIITRQRDLSIPGAIVVASLAEALVTERANGTPEVMILGGGEVYNMALPQADRVVLTELATAIDGDTTFPELPVHQWRMASRTPLVTGAKDDYAADVIVYERVR